MGYFNFNTNIKLAQDLFLKFIFIWRNKMTDLIDFETLKNVTAEQLVVSESIALDNVSEGVLFFI